MKLSYIMERLDNEGRDYELNGDRLHVKRNGRTYEFVANLAADLVSEQSTRAWRKNGEALDPEGKALEELV